VSASGAELYRLKSARPRIDAGGSQTQGSLYDFKVASQHGKPTMQSRDNRVHWPGNDEPPGGGQMEARIAKLETLADRAVERLGTLERGVAVIKSNYATRSDISEAKNSVVMWVVSAILLAQLLPALLKKFGV
jgi:hypothetical protein